jgi:hypothetical protein
MLPAPRQPWSEYQHLPQRSMDLRQGWFKACQEKGEHAALSPAEASDEEWSLMIKKET